MTNRIFYFLQRSCFKILYGTCEIYIYIHIYLFIYIASLYNSFITIISIKSMYSVVVIPKYQRKLSLCATWKTNTKRLMVTKNETRIKSKPDKPEFETLSWNEILSTECISLSILSNLPNITGHQIAIIALTQATAFRTKNPTKRAKAFDERI